jgi:hypothetical protein
MVISCVIARTDPERFPRRRGKSRDWEKEVAYFEKEESKTIYQRLQQLK